MKKKLLLSVTVLMFFVRSYSQEHPFPQNLDYQPNSIKPSGGNQKLNNDLTSFYYDWKYHYVKNYRDGVYIEHNPKDIVTYKKPNDTITIYKKEYKSTTVSEAHGYGMMIFAYMAGEDDQAKELFDKMYDYYTEHLSSVFGHPDSSLMEWKQSEGITKNNIPNGENWHGTATDGDIDIAFALLLADAQWGSSGAIDYKQEAVYMINDIMAYEIHPKYKTILLGDWAGANEKILYGKYGLGTRTSDFIIDHFRSFKNATNDSQWNQVIGQSYRVLDSMQQLNPTTGLIPDFVENAGLEKPLAAGLNFLESKNDGRYSYNACRVPWRIATDHLISGNHRAKRITNRINNWIKDDGANNDPTKIYPGYWLDGDSYIDIEDYYYSAAFVAPLAVSAMVDKRHQGWLNLVYNRLVSKSLQEEGEGYYENTIKMMCLLTLSGNYWTPESFDSSSAKVQGQHQSTVTAFPNPVNLSDRVFVNIEGKKGETVYITLDDMMGKNIWTEKIIVPSEKYKYDFSINNSKQGIHVLNVIDRNGKNATKLMVKQ